MALVNFRRYLRFKPFDTATEAGRAEERYRLAAWSIIASVGNRGSALIVMVLGIWLTIPYLGPERFGVWMTIASFASLLSFMGGGIGNALTNHVAGQSARYDTVSLRQTISGGLGLLMVVGLVVGAGLIILASWMPWGRIIKVDEPSLLLEARSAAQVFALIFGLSIFTAGIQSVFTGLQRAYEAHLVSTVGSIIAALTIWANAKSHAGIPVLLLSTFGIQTLSSLALLIFLARRNLFSMVKITDMIRVEASHLIRVGGLFFFLQLGTMIGWGADALIISSMLGPAQVAIYGVTQRLFQFISQPVAMLNSPLWGAYADAQAKGDVAFIKQTLKVSMCLTLVVSTLGASLLLAGGEYVLSYWTHDALVVPFQLIAFMAIWTVMECSGGAFGMFLNGVRVVRPQVIVVLVFCILVLPLKILGVEAIGLIAIPLSAILVYGLTHVYFYGFLFYPDIKLCIENRR